MELTLSRDSARKAIKEYAIITFGIMLYAFGYTAVIMPADIVSGGMGGIALLIYHATGGAAGGIPIGYSFFAGNAILLGIAFFIIGGKFGTKTIYSIFVTSFMMGLMARFLPPDMLGLGEDKLLSALLGGAITGASISFVLSQGGSMGGTDIIAMIVNKYRNISYGKVIMMCDFVILGSSIFIFRDISAIIYGYVSVAAFGYSVDAMLAGNKQSSQIFVVSKHYERIAARISDEMKRGVTLLDGEGWYTKHQMKMVMVVCRKNETQVLLRLVKECDPDAFITVASVMGVYGLGFEMLKK